MTFTQMAALIAGLTLAISSAHLRAQTTVDGDFQDAVIESTTKTIQEGQATSIPSGGVVIVNTNSNDNKNKAAAASESETLVQPTTVVESSPAVYGNAEAIRNARKGAEIETEQRIVEKLESSRLEDEKRRAEALFGDRFESNKKVESTKVEANDPVVVIIQDSNAKLDTKSEATAVQQQEEKVSVDVEGDSNRVNVNMEQEAEAVVVAPAAAPVVAPSAPVATVVAPIVIADDASLINRTYMSFSLGSSEYAASNVETQYAVGATFGKTLDERWSVEGRFSYSNYYINTFWINPLFSELDQYDFGVSTRFNLLTGRVQPYVGGGVAYIYRQYNERVYSSGIYDPAYYNTEEATTNAIDGNLMGGVDFRVSPRFTIGAEMSYTTNIFVKNDEPVFASQWAQPENRKPLEEIDRTSFMVNAKYMF